MKFFVLKNPEAGRDTAVTDYLPADGSRKGDAPRCLICGKFLGMIPLVPPINIEVEAWEGRWGDVAFGPGDQILISGKLKKLVAEANLVGFERLDPVKITKLKKHKREAGDPPEYWLASIQRSQAIIDESASGLIREEGPLCGECYLGGIIKRADRIVLRADTWSGEDVFFARGLPGTMLVSERFKLLSELNDLANCSFIAAENFSFRY